MNIQTRLDAYCYTRSGYIGRSPIQTSIIIIIRYDTHWNVTTLCACCRAAAHTTWWRFGLCNGKRELRGLRVYENKPLISINRKKSLIQQNEIRASYRIDEIIIFWIQTIDNIIYGRTSSVVRVLQCSRIVPQ